MLCLTLSLLGGLPYSGAILTFRVAVTHAMDFPNADYLWKCPHRQTEKCFGNVRGISHSNQVDDQDQSLPSPLKSFELLVA